MSLKKLLSFSMLTFCSSFTIQAGEWQTIPVPDSMEVTLPGGEQKTIQPSCAMDEIPVPGPDGIPVMLPNDFRFYFQPGDSDNLLIFLQGGGACWNDATCVDSLVLQQDGNPQSRPTYNPSIYTENDPRQVGGIFNDEREDNPFRDWNKVFVPYCSGDLHVGSSDNIYTDSTGAITGQPGAPVLIKHRGHDNVMAVREWLKTNYPGRTPRSVLVSGSSAGGYGATLNYPYFESVFTRSRTALLSDGAMAVMTQGFVDDVLTEGGPWNLEASLPRQYKRMLGRFYAFSLNNQLMKTLTYQYPFDRFAQYSTGLDAVQIQFFKIADQIDRGNLDPASWKLSESEFLYFLTWHFRMATSINTISAFTWNYQYYLGEGTCHTVLTDFCEQTELPVSSPSPFFNEKSAEGVAFKDWLYDFATKRYFRENSVSYTN